MGKSSLNDILAFYLIDLYFISYCSFYLIPEIRFALRGRQKRTKKSRTNYIQLPIAIGIQ